MRYIVEVEGTSYEVEIGPTGITIDGVGVEIDLQPNHDSNLWHLVLDGRSHTLAARRSDGRGHWEIDLGGRRHRALALDERSRAIRQLAGSAVRDQGPVELKAPMPGLVIKLEVEPDASVTKGQGVVVMEAMKMENELKASAAGRVSQIRVKPGQAVDKGQVLLVIEPE